MVARSVLADLMALAHEGTPYGYLADKIGPLSTSFLASRCVISAAKFNSAVVELLTAERVNRGEGQVLFIRRMVEDEELRIRRAAGGGKGGNPNLATKEVNLPPNLDHNLEVNYDSRERTRADSDSEILAVVETTNTENLPTRARDLIPPIDFEFREFMGAFLSLGVAAGPADMQKCAMAWVSLSLAEKLSALSDVRGKTKGDWSTCEVRYVPRPWNYLGSRQWERIAITNGRQKQESKGEESTRLAMEEFKKLHPDIL